MSDQDQFQSTAKENSAHLASTPYSDEALLSVFAPVFEKIKEGQKAREAERQLPHEGIQWLKEARFGAVRIPQEFGGFGVTIPQLVRLWIALATADSNLIQALRAHFALVEDYLNRPPSEYRDRWLRRFAEGDLAGNGWSEIGNAKVGELQTKISPDGDGWRINGAKYYSTGSIYADWIDVLADDSEDGRKVNAVVSTHQTGVTRRDDWDGFGQRTTGTGTTLFEDAWVEGEDRIDFTDRFVYQTAFYQLNLVAALTGVGKAIERDVAQEVASRTRVYSHGNANRVADDPQILQIVGRISAQIFAVEAAVLKAAEESQRTYEAQVAGDTSARDAANTEAELSSARAQIVAADQVLSAATSLFNALGASATRADKQLDRHWRNARTLASHNPLIYKERIIGDWVVNRRLADSFRWSIGQGK